jgi:HEAT repeat protein
MTGMPTEIDLESWEFWWGFNKAPYLQLRTAIHTGLSTTDVETFFQGPGAARQARDVFRPSPETVQRKVVPALLRALDASTDNDIVTGSLIALARIGETRREDGTSEIGTRIAGFLADPNQEIAETAALALGILGDESSVPILRELLGDTPEARKRVGRGEVPYRTRAFAAYGLGLIGSRAAARESRREIVRLLIGVVDGSRASTRDVQVGALLGISLVPLDLVPEEIGESRVDPTASRPSQIRWVLGVLRDEHRPWIVRAHAPQVLGKLIAGCSADLRDEVARRLVELADDRSKVHDSIRQGCVIGLGMIGDCDADPSDVSVRSALSKIGSGRDAQARRWSLIALAQIAGRRGSGAEAGQGRAAIVESLVSALKQGRSADRPWAGLALGVMEHAFATAGEEPSIVARAALREALADAGNPVHLGALAIGAGIAGDRESSSVLRAKFRTTNETNARGYLAVAVGLVGDRDAIDEIRAVVRESRFRPEVLRETAIALGLLGDKDLVPELVQMLQDAKALSSQASIATALGFIGDSRSIDPLVALLQREDVTPSARGFAAAALGLVADREPLPWSTRISVDLNYRAATRTLTGEGATGILDIL